MVATSATESVTERKTPALAGVFTLVTGTRFGKRIFGVASSMLACRLALATRMIVGRPCSLFIRPLVCHVLVISAEPLELEA